MLVQVGFQGIADFRLPIADLQSLSSVWKGLAEKAANRQLAIGNWQCYLVRLLKLPVLFAFIGRKGVQGLYVYA
jgi:hypothetical protein